MIQQKLSFLAGLQIIVIIILIIALLAVGKSKTKSVLLDENVEYIKTVENINPIDVENSINEVKRQQKINEIIEYVDENPDSVWKDLNDLGFVALGDSRVVGFDVYGYMDENRVLAEAGEVLSGIPYYYEWLQVLNPGILLISVGLNDINHEWEWETVYDYVSDLNYYMETLTEMLPDTTIYINSIMPAQDYAILENSRWGDIPAWNLVIEENCRERGWHYFDLTELAYEYSWLYESDGVHMNSNFYPIWAQNLLKQYLIDLTL